MGRHYSSIAQEAELTSSLSSAATSATVDALTGWPASTPFTAVIDAGTPAEEIVEVTSVGGTTLTITRGVDGSSPIAHDAGASVRHLATGRDLREPQEHIDASSNVHGTGLGNAVVGTGTTQTLTNKTINGGSNTLEAIPQSSVTDLVDDLADLVQADTDEAAARVVHQNLTAAHGATGAVVGTTNTQTLTNKTLSSPVITSPPSNVANPAGAVTMWAGGSSAPSGWLICDGSAVSRSTYSDLFAAIGTAFGSGNGSTTFNLPDFKGRVPVGISSSDAEFNTMGETGGAKTHTLTVAQMPSHNHGGSTGAQVVPADFSTADGTSGSGRVKAGSDATGRYDANVQDSTHQHGISYEGGGQAHNNLQPYLTLRFIIKT